MVRRPVRRADMRRTWRDSGPTNDAVVSASITLSLLAWLGLGWKIGSTWLMVASIILGPLAGVIGGFCLLLFLDKCRGADAPPNPPLERSGRER